MTTSENLMAWIPEVTTPQRSSLGWIDDIPVPEPRVPKLGWVDSPLVVPDPTCLELSDLGRDLAISQSDAIELLLSDVALASKIRTLKAAAGVDLSDYASAKALAGMIITGVTLSDISSAKLRTAATTSVELPDRVIIPRAAMGQGRTGASLSSPAKVLRALLGSNKTQVDLSDDSGTWGFTPQAAVANTYTANTNNIIIPVWCRYIDAICVGAGGGGNAGNQTLAHGRGGNGGLWAWWTFDRGQSRNLWTHLNITVGVGGGNKANGTESRITLFQSGTQIDSIAGAGGTWNDATGGDRDGQPPSAGNANSGRDVSHNGITYSGGGWSNSDTAQVPGSGGRGGGGAAWPLTPGSGKQGGRGQVWLRFWM